jgi:hypothetical protein
MVDGGVVEDAAAAKEVPSVTSGGRNTLASNYAHGRERGR